MFGIPALSWSFEGKASGARGVAQGNTYTWGMEFAPREWEATAVDFLTVRPGSATGRQKLVAELRHHKEPLLGYNGRCDRVWQGSYL